MAQVKVRWTRLALSDLNQAYEYMAEEAPEVAHQIMNRIEKGIEALSRYPDIGRMGRVAGTKELVILDTPFIVAYRTKSERVEILSIIHSSMKWPDIL